MLYISEEKLRENGESLEKKSLRRKDVLLFVGRSIAKTEKWKDYKTFLGYYFNLLRLVNIRNMHWYAILCHEAEIQSNTSNT